LPKNETEQNWLANRGGTKTSATPTSFAEINFSLRPEKNMYKMQQTNQNYQTQMRRADKRESQLLQICVQHQKNIMAPYGAGGNAK